ncbi:hypothetical protein HRI_000509600 [Hibiscus trionum]|uniref:Uncharacterized protein n=1 Tax=Hibiscus trionum TaxID=183268 RepID=A0A9W7LKR9_HIBTR|nr:hypothetical protein HRI_000509600 [Hibiscus trionum]
MKVILQRRTPNHLDQVSTYIKQIVSLAFNKIGSLMVLSSSQVQKCKASSQILKRIFDCHCTKVLRYSDFIVNEVDNEGNVVHLTSLDAPPETQAFEEGETKTSDQLNKNYASEIEKFRSLACETDVDSLEALINKITSGSEEDISPIVLSPDSDKSHRTAMHNFFKENLRFLVTDTVDGPDSSTKCIRVRLNSENNKRGGNSNKRKRGDEPYDSRGSSHWPEHLGKFLRFHLFKENKDTQEALGLIGKMLGIQTSSFGFVACECSKEALKMYICNSLLQFYTFHELHFFLVLKPP